jgi:hypothetical protein
MKTNYVLIDFESVHVKSLALLAGEHFRVLLFLGPNHTKVPTGVALAMHDKDEQSRYVKLATPGPNALDFLVAYHLGNLAAVDPTGFFHIISKDTGFDPLIQHLKTKLKIFAARSESIEEMPCFRAAPTATSKSVEAVSPEAAGNGNGVDALVKLAVDDLVKRKAAKPRRLAALRNTVLARIGKDAAGSLDSAIEELVRSRRITIDGGKVAYDLPE